MQYTHRWQSAARTSNNDASPLAPQPRGELRRTVRSISSIPDADSDQRLALRPIWLPSHPLLLPSLRSEQEVGAGASNNGEQQRLRKLVRAGHRHVHETRRKESKDQLGDTPREECDS
eukprot:Tamp_19807.p3 GENE.Tamp_19807~~Tamp_19807.p3  ORF type:complete len:118 (-),score=14.50 Tamp_19807:45-398(-)